MRKGAQVQPARLVPSFSRLPSSSSFQAGFNSSASQDSTQVVLAGCPGFQASTFEDAEFALGAAARCYLHSMAVLAAAPAEVYPYKEFALDVAAHPVFDQRLAAAANLVASLDTQRAELLKLSHLTASLRAQGDFAGSSDALEKLRSSVDSLRLLRDQAGAQVVQAAGEFTSLVADRLRVAADVAQSQSAQVSLGVSAMVLAHQHAAPKPPVRIFSLG